jgi:hypothetical protein
MIEEQKPPFWKTPEGKIMSYGIHEHNGGLANINHSVEFIKKLIQEGKIKIKGTDEIEILNDKYIERFMASLERILDGKDKCRDSMDYVYTKLKEIQGL